MYLRGLFAACVAVVLCATVVETVEAYPIKARSGATTVTGMYRPLNLDLAVVEGAGGFNLNDGYAEISLMMTGSYTGVGYTASGVAGNWALNLEFGDQLPDVVGTVAGDVITAGVPTYLPAISLPYYVGTLQYIGGGSFGSVPPGDTPREGDIFELFAEAPGGVLEVTCSESVSTCGAFTAKLLQSLTHQGPYVSGFSFVAGAGLVPTLLLDDGGLCNTAVGIESTECSPSFQRVSRVNVACFDAEGNNRPCGSVPKELFDARGANVPEPASLALVGLGLVALAVGRRRRQPRLRAG